MKTLFGKLKQLLNILIGMCICRISLFKKYKLYLLSSWEVPGKRKWIDNLLYRPVLLFWFDFEYLPEKDPDKRELLKGILMGGEGGREWAKYYDSCPLDFEAKIGRLKYDVAYPILSKLDISLSSLTTPIVVIQIGSSSGKEIAWLAERNPAHTYVGTDIYHEVIAYSSKSHNLPNLTFRMCSAKDISALLDIYKNQKIIIFSSGSLQYVQPGHLEIFFNSISHRPGLEVVLLEPANELKGDPMGLNKSLWRGNFSWTHDYRFYSERAGLATQICEIIKPYFPREEFPVHIGTVHYWYWARAKACYLNNL